MSGPKISTAEILVHFVQPGVGVRDYLVSERATLADVLLLSGILTANQAVLIDGVPSEEALPLRDGVVVTVMPRSRNDAGDEPWRAAVPAFRDEAVFREYSEALEARRRGVDPAGGPDA